MFQKDEFESRQDGSFYETGRTRPPKNYGGPIAVLLIVAIFLGGILSAMNSLKLSPSNGVDASGNAEKCLQFSQLSDLETTALESSDQSSVSCAPTPGFTGEFLSALDQKIYRLPNGIYITQVTPGSDAEKKGISPGDILLHLDDKPITDQESLDAVLCNHLAGDTVKAIVYRGEKQYTVQLVLSEDNG